MTGDLIPAAGISGLFGTLAILIWRIVRLGVDQEQRLLKPAYERIERLEKRLGNLEREHRGCQEERATYRFLLESHGIAIPGRGSA